ncbi:MAG: hypothetical protein GY782_11365 [Gammaproteobacteria bacterium]|nr:hypothetical protein [Gammaproteobacteria bacterium]
MALMTVDLVKELGGKALVVLDAYFAVGPVFLILKKLTKLTGERLVHLITRAKSNAVAYEDPPPKTGGRGAPRKYGAKLTIAKLFHDRLDEFQETTIEIYKKSQTVQYLCLDLIWKPIKEKLRFVLVIDDDSTFILMCSDLSLPARDIITAYSYRFKIEVNFKVLKHLMGVFFYHFWTKVWPKIANGKESDLSFCNDSRSKKLIRQTTNAIEGFVNFGCIATGILQILSLNCHQTIWKNYSGWLRTISSAIPSEETVRSVVQEEFFHNFRIFSNTMIYQIIMSKCRRPTDGELQVAA